MADIQILFFKLREMLREKLLPFGFLLGREEYYPDIFGNRLVEYQSGSQKFQLVWDGRDGALFLQYCDNILDYHFQHWKAVANQTLDINGSMIETTLVEKFMNELEEFLTEGGFNNPDSVLSGNEGR